MDKILKMELPKKRKKGKKKSKKNKEKPGVKSSFMGETFL